MRCLIGLGNPGSQYAATRHNVGFRVIERLAGDHQVRLRSPLTHPYRAGQGRLGGEQVVLAQPLTFMNASGRAVLRLMQRFRLRPEDLLVVYDDLDLELGRLRLRAEGSPGTHNGMRSVVAEVGTPAVPRLRLGIGPLPPRTDPKSFVLSPFAAEEQEAAEQMVNKAAEAAAYILRAGWQAAMNEYNR